MVSVPRGPEAPIISADGSGGGPSSLWFSLVETSVVITQGPRHTQGWRSAHASWILNKGSDLATG